MIEFPEKIEIRNPILTGSRWHVTKMDENSKMIVSTALKGQKWKSGKAKEE